MSKATCQTCGNKVDVTLGVVPVEAEAYLQTITALEFSRAFLRKADPDCIGPCFTVEDRRNNEQERWVMELQLDTMLRYARRRYAKGFLLPCSQ